METRTPVLLVHGLAGSARWWQPAERALGFRHDVHALDLPGFGSARRVRFGLDAAAALVAERLERLGRAHVVGHSLGGLVCARVAAARPELVERLVLVAPAGALPRRSLLAHAWPLAAALRSVRPSFVCVIVGDAFRAGPRTVLRAARDVVGADVVADLRKIVAPTLLVWGERDLLVPPSVGRLFEREIADARLAVLERASHIPMVERPDAFAHLVLAFLARAAG